MVSAGLVFGMIFAVIVIAMLFAFGLPQLTSIFKIGGQAQLQKEILHLKNVVLDLYDMAQGSSETFKLSIPADTRICFIDPENPQECIWSEHEIWKWWQPNNATLYLLQEGQYKGSNVWIERKPLGEGYFIPHLKPKQESCANFCVKNGITLYLENEGEHVSISVK